MATRPIPPMRSTAPRPPIEAGARWVVLCDTNGGTLPEEVERIVGEVATVIPGDHLGIHAHDDTEQAVANSLAAVRAGARQIQGTLNGLGERCGNANLTSLIPTLLLKPAYRRALRDRRHAGKARHAHPSLAQARRDPQPDAGPPRALCRLLGLRDQGRHPRLGRGQGPDDLRACGAGDGRQPAQGAGLRPGRQVERPGRARSASASRSSGTIRASTACSRTSRSARPRAMPMRAPTPRSTCWPADPRRGAGFLLHRALQRQCRAALERARRAGQRLGGDRQGEGRRRGADLGRRGQRPGQRARPARCARTSASIRRFIAGPELVDYKVRIFQGGTDAVTRVLIEFQDGAGERWSTVGVSANIIDASFQALDRLDDLQADQGRRDGSDQSTSVGTDMPRSRRSTTASASRSAGITAAALPTSR